MLRIDYKLFLLGLACLFTVSACKDAEIGPIQSKSFLKFYGTSSNDKGNDLKQTSDEGYIVVGSVTLNLIETIYCLKVDKNGNTEWENTFGTGVANSVQITSNGDFLVVGDDGKFVNLLLINSSGSQLWKRSYGDSMAVSEGLCVQQTFDGGYVLLGTTTAASSNGNPVGEKDAYVIRTNSTGDTLWTNQYGGVEDDIGNYILQKLDGSFIFAGTTETFPNATGSNVWVVEIDANGGILGYITIDESFLDRGNGIEMLSDGSFVVTGTKAANADDILLIKLGSDIFDQSSMWVKSYGSSGRDFGSSVKQTSDGGFIICGWTTGTDGLSSLAMIKADASGNQTWLEEFGGVASNIGNATVQTRDGGYACVGVSIYDDNAMVLLIKTDENGILITE